MTGYKGKEVIILIEFQNEVKEIKVHSHQPLLYEIKRVLGISDIVITINSEFCSEIEPFIELQNRLSFDPECKVVQIELIQQKQKNFDTLQIEKAEISKENSNFLSVVEDLQKKISNFNTLQIEKAEISKENSNLRSVIEDLQKNLSENVKLIKELQTKKENIYKGQILAEGKLQNALKANPSNPKDFEKSQIFFDPHRIIQANEYMDYLILTKKGEVKKLKQKSDIMKKNSAIFQSCSISQKFGCQFCGQPIDSDTVQLNCHHSYHDECFDNLLQSQLAQKQDTFHCLCGDKLQQQALKLLSNKLAQEIYHLQLISIQLEKIKEKSQNIKVCERKYCSFFYINNNKFKDLKSYCPLCLI